MQVCDSAQYHEDQLCFFVFSSLSHSVLSKEPSWDCFFFLYVSWWNDNNVSNLVTLHAELSMLMMGWPPPCSTEMLTFNLCTVISPLHTWNWCTLFLLIKSKTSRGSRQVGDLLPYTAITKTWLTLGWIRVAPVHLSVCDCVLFMRPSYCMHEIDIRLKLQAQKGRQMS